MTPRWLVATLLSLASAAAQDDGKALLERTCSKCHTLDATVRQRNSKERWSTIVDDMASRGAEATDAELEKIIDYLAKNMGPKVNVNQATSQDLAAKLGFSAVASAAIVEYREKNGSFKSIDDLKKVSAVDPAEIESRKDRMSF